MAIESALARLESFLDELQDPVPERFTVENEGQADWALRKLARCQHRIEELQDVAKTEIQKIESWLLKELAEEERSVAFFTGLLNAYHSGLYEQDPKRYKTLKLPNGVLKRVKSQPSFVRDEEELLRWLEERKLEQFVQRTAKPKWGELKKNVVVAGNSCVMPITGEVVEGVAVIPQEEKFQVEVV